MFSHTAKGQMYNMPLLSRFVGEGKEAPRLIDYELLTGSDGKRVVGFGWFAGGELLEHPLDAPGTDKPLFPAAGLVEGLSASAHDFLSLGVSSPFLVSRRSRVVVPLMRP